MRFENGLTEERIDALILANGSSGRELGYAQITSNFVTTAAAASPADITGLSISPVVADRPIVLEVFCPLLTHSAPATGVSVQVKLYEGATLLSLGTAGMNGSAGDALVVKRRLAPTAGTHTYKATLNVNGAAGTATLFADAQFPAYIIAVEG